jgi:hypothetical protein
MADWGPVVVSTIMLALLSPGLLLHAGAGEERPRSGVRQPAGSAASIFVHASFSSRSPPANRLHMKDGRTRSEGSRMRVNQNFLTELNLYFKINSTSLFSNSAKIVQI